MNIKKIKLIDVCITITFVVLSVIGFYVYKKMNVEPIDFNGNRIICGYVLYGINPLKHIGEPALIDYLGVVPAAFGNLPYGLLLGNLFYFGNLDLDKALFSFRVVSISIVILTIFVAKKFFEKYKCGDRLFYYFVLFTVLSLHIACSYTVGNVGHIVCMLLVICIFLCDESFIFSGIALSLAMIKPQISFPFCITLLFLKKYKVVFFAALIDIIASLICACMVKENVINLFLDFLNANVGGGGTVYGLFTIFYGDNYYSALFPSMFAGLVILILAHIFTSDLKDNLVPFIFPSLVANIWSYSWSSDYYILIIPAIAFLYLFFINSNNSKKDVFFKTILVLYSFIFLFLIAIKNFLRGQNYLSEIFKSLYEGKSYMERIVISNSISYVIMLIGIVFSIVIIRYYNMSGIFDEEHMKPTK